MIGHRPNGQDEESTLDALIESVAEAQRHGVGPGLERLGDALITIGRRVELRSLSVQDGRHWVDTLINTAAWPAGPLTTLERQARLSGSKDSTTSLRRRFRRQPRVAIDLLNVVLVNHELPGLDAVRIQTVELYSNAITVRWAKPTPSTHEPALAWRLTDDLQTSYQLIGGGGGSIGRGTWHGHITFLPAAVPDARQLHIQVNEEMLAVSV